MKSAFKRKILPAFSCLLFLILISCSNVNSLPNRNGAQGVSSRSEKSDLTDIAYQEYIEFFEEIYQSMQANYYRNIDRSGFDRFIKQFNTKIYTQLIDEGKSNSYIRWRSAAFLVDFLKDPEDIFSAFYPPKPAKEYEETALGMKVDLGIEGNLKADGYFVKHVEPRSDAYGKGLRPGDLILEIDQQNLLELDESKITELLNPLVDSLTKILYLSAQNQQKTDIEVLSKEYFRQTVFAAPVPIPGIYCLEIRKFNRKTSDDLFRYLTYFRSLGEIKGLILDLRNNPGGPPLAAREISSFFLPPRDPFAIFMKRGEPIAALDVPEIPVEYHYDGPMVILVNKGSGSASELFSGILQKKGRAILIGTNSAGQVMLKSMYHFDDESMLLLVTARGHHPGGEVFSFKGLVPDRRIKEKEENELLKYAAAYLVYLTK